MTLSYDQTAGILTITLTAAEQVTLKRMVQAEGLPAVKALFTQPITSRTDVYDQQDRNTIKAKIDSLTAAQVQAVKTALGLP